MSRRPALVIGLTVYLACVLACGGAGSQSSGGKDTSHGGAVEREIVTSSKLFKVGEVVEVQKTKTEPWLALDDEAYVQGGRPQSEEFKSIAKAGRALKLGIGTRVEIIEEFDISCRVKVLDGPHKGKSGRMNDVPLGSLERRNSAKP